MNAINVILTEDGAFEIVSPFPGKRDYRIFHDTDPDNHPWKVISEMGCSGVWREEDRFQSLDEALDWAVSLSSETYPVPAYGVTLPCGTYMARPGKVKIEDAMAGFGWSYIVSAMGWSHASYPADTPHSTVQAHFEEMVEDTLAILGDVEACPDRDDRGMCLWIADITIPVYAFVRTDNAKEVLLALFEEEGIPCTDAFDYTGRVNVTPHSALIIELDAARLARTAVPELPVSSAEAGRKA